MDDPIEIRVTVHWPEETNNMMGNRLYTLRVNGKAEYVALLQRLAGYAFKEERLIHHDHEVDRDRLEEEKATLEWRMNMLNMQLATQQGGNHVS